MANNDVKDHRAIKLYRLYHVGQGGGIEAVSVVEAAEQAEAIKQAEELLQTSSGELWLQDKMVSTVDRRAE